MLLKTPFPILHRECCLSWITQLPLHCRVSIYDHNLQHHPRASCYLLAKETTTVTSLGHLLQLIKQGKQTASNDPLLTSLHPICESLYSEEGILLYQDRVKVPPSLCCRVLQNLHVAHKGTSTMEQCALAIVYWPGMSKDIRETRKGCTDCNKNTPLWAATPPLQSMPPLSPFEAIFADFFDY